MILSVSIATILLVLIVAAVLFMSGAAEDEE